ncbi:sensor histidine kinase [Pedobacter frigoris]|uniref:sensor histidine kinase n=1 Tax=Pedobacter frigoris TaxID=2571272 RepID=UPI0029307753|nr:sensor histidine kinase [Pedobacter frigoris]
MKKIKPLYWIPLLGHMLIIWIIINMKAFSRLYYSYPNEKDLELAWESFMNRNFESPNYYYIINCLFILVPLIEVNYWLVIEKYNLLKSILITIGIFFIYQIIISIPIPISEIKISQVGLRAIEPILLLTFYATGYGFARKLICQYLKKKTDTIQRYGHELQTLRAQWNPHFFFNSLNYLYGTALEENAPRTSEAVEILSKMMRYSVSTANEQWVPLKQELEFIDQYFAIQKLRLPNHPNIAISQSIETDAEDYKIPPMLILPFVENAFKYGVSLEKPCSIKMSILVSKNDFTLEINNSIFNTSHLKGNQTGLVNTKKLLSLIYGDKFTLIHQKTEAAFQVMLKLHLTRLFA